MACFQTHRFGIEPQGRSCPGDVGVTMKSNREDRGWVMFAPMIQAMGQTMGRAVHRARWLALSVLWGGLLLLALAWGFDATTARVVAAVPQASNDVPAIAFGSATYTVSEADGSGTVLLVVEPPVTTPATVTVFSNNVQAEASEDFEGLRQSLLILPNEASYTLSLTLLDDALAEGDEQLRLTLSLFQGVSPGVITETLVTIADDDIARLGVRDVVVDEDDASVTLVVTQSITSTLESMVDVRTQPGSATAPDDFEALSTTVTIPPGSTEATVTVLLHGDEEMEPTETFFVVLEDPTNAEIEDGMAIVTLLDDDVFPKLEVEAAAAHEADGLLPFVATLSSIWPQTVTVEYDTVDGSALSPDDYLASRGVLIFPPGDVSATVWVTVVEDQSDEPDETFYLALSNPVQVILSSAQVEGTIRDGFGEFLYLPGIVR